MSEIIKHSKKVLSATLAVSTIVWAVGLFALAPVEVGARAGDLVKKAGDPAVYLVDADGVTIHPFPHQNVYESWGYPQNFSTVLTTDISGFTVGNDVEFRDGALVRALETPAVYVVSGKTLRPVISAEVFEALGYDYDNITWLPQSFLDKYGATGTMIQDTTIHPDGTLVKYASSSTVYLLQNGAKRAFSSSSVVASNGYSRTPVITIPSSETYVDGAAIVVTEESLMVPTGVGSAPSSSEVSQPVGTGLTVALASGTPVATTVIADSRGVLDDGAQAFVPFIKVALTAGSDGAVKVTNMAFKRSGISADADLSALYLYEGDGLGNSFLAASTSLSSGVVTFNNPSGIITVPAGQTKYVMLRADIADDVGSGKTISFTLESASGVTTDGATVSGSFPMAGNTMSTATTATLGSITVAGVSPLDATTVDPGSTNFELWRFSLTAADQDMEVRYMKISMTGSASSSDVNNFRLETAGTTLASVASMNSNDEIVFDLSANPYKIEKGQVKNISLYGDVVSGSSRTIHFQIQEMYNMNVYDTEYNVYTKVNKADSWTIVESHSSTTNTTINAGTLTISKSSDSPTGNIASNATGVVMARFDFKANGEDVRVNNLTVASSRAIDEAKVYFNGSQVGSTTDLNTSALFSFGTSVVIPAGQTKVIEIRADAQDNNGNALADGATVAITLSAGSSNARALSSSTAISTSEVTGNTLTVRTGTLSISENTAVNDASASNPSGVKGQSNILIGSFILAAGTGEGVTISQITMKDDADGSTTGSSLADQFYNLRLESAGPADMNGNYTSGTAIGTTVGTLTDTVANTYNFNPTPNIKLAASQKITINVYASSLNSATSTQLNSINNDTGGIIIPSAVSATGNDTSRDASATSATALQAVYISSSGNMIVESVATSNQAKARIVTAGLSDVELYKFKITALVEDVEITRFVINDTIVSTAVGATSAQGKPTSTFLNFKLREVGGSEISSGAYLYSTSTPTDGGYVDFNLGSANSYTVKAGQEKTLVLTGTVNSSSAISSGSTHQFSLRTDSIQDGSTYAVTGRGKGSNTEINRPTTAQTGLAITVRAAYPLVERQSLSSSTLPKGNTTDLAGAKFKVTAVGGKISLKKMTFQVTLSDTTTTTLLELSSFKLYRDGALMGSTEYSIYDGTGTAQADELSHSGTAKLSVKSLNGTLGTHNGNTESATSTYITVLLGTQRTDIADGQTAGSGEEVIEAGDSNTYELRFNVTNAFGGTPATDNDSIVIQLLGDASETEVKTANLGATATGTYHQGIVGLGTTNYNFLWSDYSANIGDHTSSFKSAGSTGKDWTHGYQVPSSSTQDSYIPLETWTLS